ncbi:YitT family protein [Bulleidia sp. zg-1006]|uniref:YitT family protein n=1 Tax=Bulleidia sp. zg-1006 TaxID=2806552 RepID=UPI00193A1A75|nr:YitT family protein [Bulleidia sp. zg-1006]QRG86848.1 YitT family protein [Bulleidia sp. zg-1006]
MDRKVIKNLIFVVIGTFLLTVSVQFFILPYHILSGGVAGLAVAFNPFFHIDETLFANVLVLVLFVIGAWTLGKEFAINTMVSSLLYPVFNGLLSHIALSVEIPTILASFYAGLIGGAGIGLVMRTGASTGGMDVPPLIVHKYFGVKVSTLVIITDGLTVLLGVAAYGLSAALIGLVSVFSAAAAIDRVLSYGQGSRAKSVQIISEHWEEIVLEVSQRLKRSATVIQSTGGFTKEVKPMVLCAVSDKQYSTLMAIINEIDDKAFVITTDASDMHGEGFTYPSVGI